MQRNGDAVRKKRRSAFFMQRNRDAVRKKETSVAESKKQEHAGFFAVLLNARHTNVAAIARRNKL